MSRTVKLPGPGVLLGVFPHMHGLGRRIRLQRGNTCVVDLPFWEVTAQQPYFFENMTGVRIAEADSLSLSCTWNNPNSTRVGIGESSGEEMCLAYDAVRNWPRSA